MSRPFAIVLAFGCLIAMTGMAQAGTDGIGPPILLAVTHCAAAAFGAIAGTLYLILLIGGSAERDPASELRERDHD
ncbi:hypothetical protein ACXN5S_05785 [Pseudoroseicyclus sp. H15]